MGGETGLPETNHLVAAIQTFPRLEANRYRPDIAARSANILIAAGPAAAKAALESMIQTNRIYTQIREINKRDELNQQLCHLIRLLFVSTNLACPLRAPQLGIYQSLPVLTMKTNDWPDLPFVRNNNIPLSFNLGYCFGGVPEPAANYLAYCTSHGSFRTELFADPSWVTASNALKQVLDSTAWRSLKWTDKEFGFTYNLDRGEVEKSLWEQITHLVQATNSSLPEKRSDQRQL